ncbi:hypothetical protein [Methylomonas rivi]|uniref:Uncharacterized protein n=1 Tax=Methylomonas rivi TaxID=2952226 RepID=A0ABT1U5P3_9GAMM|nr:hypothetical protein [Methylomonas sp. WSC-6]MCQ8128690.1 hypothetical protein [Methylomonas sp. WSC-6]
MLLVIGIGPMLMIMKIINTTAHRIRGWVDGFMVAFPLLVPNGKCIHILVMFVLIVAAAPAWMARIFHGLAIWSQAISAGMMTSNSFSH